MDAAYPIVANIAAAVPKYIPHDAKDAWRICVPVAAALGVAATVYFVRRQHKRLKDEYNQKSFDAMAEATALQALKTIDKQDQNASLATSRYTSAHAANPLRPKWLGDAIADAVRADRRHLANKLPLVVDFSAHTRVSLYGMLTPKQLVQWEVCNGYDAVVVTDACSCAAVRAAQEEAAKIAPGFRVLPGFRVTGESPKMQGYRICVCGSDRVPLVAKIAGSVPGDMESRALLQRVNKWAEQNGFLVYSDAQLGCSKVYDIGDPRPSTFAVVFVDRAAYEKDPTKEIVRAVRKGSWRNVEEQEHHVVHAKEKEEEDEKDAKEPQPHVPAVTTCPNPRRLQFEQRWRMLLPKK
jgi:hypothetical protein